MATTSGCASEAPATGWYLQQGKSRPLCQDLLEIVSIEKSEDGRPNAPWTKVLSAAGIKEPEWKEVDLDLEKVLFERAHSATERLQMAIRGNQGWSLTRWANAKDGYLPAEDLSPMPATTAEVQLAFRTFKATGGITKVANISSNTNNSSPGKAIIQFEKPMRQAAEWDGYSIVGKDLALEFSDVELYSELLDLGRGLRILIYDGAFLSFFWHQIYGADQYLVARIDAGTNEDTDRYQCLINFNSSRIDKQ